MSAFLEQYGVAIFTLILTAILVAFAGPVGKIVKNAINTQVQNIDKIGTEAVEKRNDSSDDTAEEDYVRYARFRGLSEFTIGKNYVMRNSILTQITALAMSLGGVFGGSIMTEIIFGYPGVGSLIQAAILQSDYNMILGCITISIVAIASATLIVDLIYPFIDPRIRYG